jgi:hypothetical protein
MKKVFLHLGAHKTATTFIQKNLAASRAMFDAQGWTVVHFHEEQPKLHRIFRALRKGQRLHARARVESYFEQLKTSPQNIMFTCEGMLGSPRNLGPAGLYPDRVAAAKLLREFFTGCDVTLGFALRNFADFLESIYCYLVGMEGYSESFEDFIADVDPKDITWLGLAEDLCELFGAGNVRLWTFEEFRKNSTSSYMKLMDVAGINSSRLSIPIPQPVNVSISAAVVPVQLLWNKVIGRGHKSVRGPRKRQARKMSAALARLPLAERGQLMSQGLRAALDAKYADDLDAIRERWPSLMIPLP